MTPSCSVPTDWLPPGKRAAVIFHVDDVHPGRSNDVYEAGGDLGAGALGHVAWLLDRHPELRACLFVCPDWREISPVPTRRLLARVPLLRERVYLAPIRPKGTMRLGRHPEFVSYISSLPRTEIALHGLHHVHRGRSIPVEFQHQSEAECAAMLDEAESIFAEAGLPKPRGMTPPAFHAPDGLLRAMAGRYAYVATARDIFTDPQAGALSAMSGMRGVPLFSPAVLDSGLAHIPTNFQATSPPDRAIQIAEMGGLLSIKAHIIKSAAGFIALDGLDALYRNYLDMLFSDLERRFGDSLWWTTPGEIAERVAPRAIRNREMRAAAHG